MSIITDEMVAVARRAFSAAFVAAGDGQCALTAALAAVVPLIAEAERGRCLAVARRWTRDGQSATAHGIILGIEELDAIRARSTKDTTP